MNRRLALTTGLCVLLGARAAGAQELKIGYQGLPQRAASEAPNGIQVADGVVMHLGAGAETGYDTNVFYQSGNQLGSGILRTNAFAQIGNATRTGQVPAGLVFGAGTSLTYRRYLSSDPTLDSYRNAFMPAAHLNLGVNGGQFSAGFTDSFVRMEDTPYVAGQQSFIRNSNIASVDGKWSPGGGRLSGMLRYTNIIDIFETDQLRVSNSLTHQLMLDASWKWLPKTALFIQATQGYVTYLRDDAEMNGKVSSFPLRALAGLRGLITQRIAALLALGYANGFYSSGATTNGILGSSYLNAQITVTPTVVSRFVAGYKHDFTNSVVGHFYYDDSIYLSYLHQLAGRVSVDLSGRYNRKDYRGYTDALGVEIPRRDNMFMLGATIDYSIRNWIYAGVGYSMIANSSDATLAAGPGGGMATSLDYVKQQVFVRLGVTY